jgi:imidazolonepropionase-like amidohydrolase
MDSTPFDPATARAPIPFNQTILNLAAQIKEAGLSVILPADIVFHEKDPETGELKLRNLPSMFQNLRIPFAFQINPSSYDARYLWQVAAEAVKYGLSKGSAIGAITSTAAALSGIGAQTGQISPGRQADLLFLNGDVLDPKTWIDKVMIQGTIVYDRAKDPSLRKLLEGKKR